MFYDRWDTLSTHKYNSYNNPCSVVAFHYAYVFIFYQYLFLSLSTLVIVQV